MEKKSIDFQLKETLKYSHKGDFEETATIMMNAPTPEVFDQVCDLSQLVMTAFTDAQKLRGNPSADEITEAKEKIDDGGMEAEEIKVILFASQSVKFTQIADEFNVLADKVCEVNKGIKLTPVIIAKMGIDDRINMICTYIANFIAPSLL